MSSQKHSLKPCPFCGGTPRIENAEDDVMGEIICAGCDFTMMASAVQPDLLTAWNRRLGEADLIAALTDARNALREYENDVDAERPYSHVAMMRRIDAALDGNHYDGLGPAAGELEEQ